MSIAGWALVTGWAAVLITGTLYGAWLVGARAVRWLHRRRAT